MKTAAGTVPTLQEFKVDRESLRVGRGGRGGGRGKPRGGSSGEIGSEQRQEGQTRASGKRCCDRCCGGSKATSRMEASITTHPFFRIPLNIAICVRGLALVVNTLSLVSPFPRVCSQSLCPQPNLCMPTWLPCLPSRVTLLLHLLFPL